MERIKPQGNVQMVLPLDAYDNDAMIKELVTKGAFLGLKSEQVLDNGVPKVQILLNFIEDDLANYIIANYQLNWLKPYNYPYIELDEGTDTGELYIYEKQRRRKDGKMLIRIDKAGDQQTPLLPTFEELKEWQKLGSIICEPKNVADKIMDYEIDNIQ